MADGCDGRPDPAGQPAAMEPRAHSSRQTGDMTSPSAKGPSDPHDGHDLESIAALADGDLSNRDRSRAEALVRDCPACGALLVDLRAIAAATRRLPSTASAPRDFRLSPADAARLRRGSWRRVLQAVGRAGWSPRPFAAAFTTLGIVGLLIATLPFVSVMQSGGGISAQNAAVGATGDRKTDVDVSNGPHAPSAAPTPLMGVFQASPAGAADGAGPVQSRSPEAASPSTPAGPGTSTPYANPKPSSTAPRSAPSSAPSSAPASVQRAAPLMLFSIGFIGVGLALFALGRRSRRGR